jgi:hypothetical protein
LKKSDPDQFEFIGLDADTQAAKDAYRMLPDDTQNYIKKRQGRHGIYVRKNMYNYLLGHREVSVTSTIFNKYRKYHKTRGTTGKIPLVVWTAGETAENIWKEIVSFARVKTSILLPDVVFGNMLSNGLMLLADGVPPQYILKKGVEAIKAMRDYQAKRNERDKLQAEILGRVSRGYSEQQLRPLQARLRALEEDLRTNPVDQMVQEGMFQAIVEDINPELFEAGYTQHIQKQIGKVTERISSGSELGRKATAVAKELSMLPGSRLFAAAVAANQYGDFVARYVMYKYDTEVRKVDKQKAIDKAMDAFIYYDEPSDPRIAALESYGVLMFWKFFARIQRVIPKLFLSRPASFTMAGVIDAYTGNEGVNGYFMNVDKLTNKIDIPPIERLGEAAPWPIGNELSPINHWMPWNILN